MALPDSEWLHLAQRLPVGATSRHYHLRESRPNLVVGHDSSHYWAYCQACKQGGKVIKSHVLVTGVKAPAASTDLSLPRDMLKVHKADQFTQESIARFLAGKGMDMLFMPELWYSAERKRLLIQTKQGWIGRDLTGDSKQKWLTYSAGCTYLADRITQHVILVEDAFSWIKTSYAVSTTPSVSCVCLLGTEIRPQLLNAILRQSVTSAHLLLDGDLAGHSGARRGQRLLRPYVQRCSVACAPLGKDPKDLRLAELRELCALHSPALYDSEISLGCSRGR